MKWRCKQTGTIIELPDSETESMLQMEHYEQVKEEKKPVSLPKKKEDK